MAMAQGQAPQVNVKVEGFRSFVQTLFAQVGEQMCAEFEREVAQLTDDVATYRTELARCGELLAMQLGREKQLHGMLESIAGNSGTLVGNVNDIGKTHEQLHDSKSKMHDMVEQMFGHSAMAVSSAVQGVSEAHMQTHTHLQQAKEMQNQALTAENELNRIMSILTQPPVVAGQVLPTGPRTDYRVPAPMFAQPGGMQPPNIGVPSGMGMGGMGMPRVGTPNNGAYGGMSPMRSPVGSSKSPNGMNMSGGFGGPGMPC